MAQVFYDQDGNAFTADQIRAQAQPDAPSTLGDVAPEGSTPTGDAAAVDKLVSQATAHPGGAKRELNPMHFGQFFKDNIAAPTLNADYVTGKRPMNALDYATDVLSAYGGEDLGKRNASIRKADKGDSLLALKAARLGAQTKQAQAATAKSGAETQKVGLDTNKLMDTAISDTFENYDSDLWSKRVQELAKEHGITIPASSGQMIDRAMKTMQEAGATSIHEVLSNPGKYDPKVYNRVRHLTALINNHVEKSQESAALTEQRVNAAALSRTRGAVAVNADQRSAAKTAADPNVQNAQEQGIVPRVIPGAPSGTKPTSDEQIRGTRQAKSDAAAGAAANRAAQVNARSVEENLGVLERFFTDPQYDEATKILPKALGTGAVAGQVGRAQAAKSSHFDFPGALRTGDPRAQYLDSATQTIIPRVRADAMGTAALRINTKEINLLGKEAQRLAEGNMTQQEAAAHKARALNLVKQVRAQLEEDRKKNGSGTGLGQTFQHPSGATITRTK